LNDFGMKLSADIFSTAIACAMLNVSTTFEEEPVPSSRGS